MLIGKLGDLRVELAREFLAVIAAGDGGAKDDDGVDAFLGEQVQEVRTEDHVAPVTNLVRGGATFNAVADPRGGHGPAAGDGRFEQGRTEREDGVAAGAGPLGEDAEQRLLPAHGFQAFVYRHDVGLAAAVHVDGSRAAREPADHGPAPHLDLGDEDGRAGGGQHGDVHVAEVIGHQQAVARRRTVDGDLDGEDLEEATAPALGPGGTATVVKALFPGPDDEEMFRNRAGGDDEETGQTEPDPERISQPTHQVR